MDYHLMAFLKRGKSIVKTGSNSKKTHPKFTRIVGNKKDNAYLHAEMNVLRFAKPGDILIVVRYLKRGKTSMSMPCVHCRKHIKEAGISMVYYTDWNGKMQKLDPRTL
jgi:deoxycytidylate deaminase